jgi:hypothetical protein
MLMAASSGRWWSEQVRSGGRSAEVAAVVEMLPTTLFPLPMGPPGPYRPWWRASRVTTAESAELRAQRRRRVELDKSLGPTDVIGSYGAPPQLHTAATQRFHVALEKHPGINGVPHLGTVTGYQR